MQEEGGTEEEEGTDEDGAEEGAEEDGAEEGVEEEDAIPWWCR